MGTPADALYRALFERGADAVIVADDGGTILEANPAACELLGHSVGEIVGSSVTDIVQRGASETRSLWEQFAHEGTQRGELELARADGTSIPVEYNAVRDIVPGRHVSVLRDIRARREVERFRDEILATITHELRTPLQAILGWADVLDGESDPAEIAHGLERIATNARTQARLVEDLLDLSRISRGKIAIERRPIDVAVLIRNALETAVDRAEGKGVELVVEIDPDMPALDADPHRIQQVVWNLATNAVKFTPRGGRVRVRAQHAGDTVCIEVSDTGVGIPPEEQERVFEPFGQIGSRSTRREGGLGLGLAISRHLVERHGGRIDVEREGRGKGSTFRVVLPASAATAPERAASEPTQRAEPPEQRLSGIRILLCDDDEDTRFVLSRMLMRHGAEVLSVGSADEALAILRDRSREIHLLVSDLAMPHRDGLSLVRDLRRLDVGSRSTLPAIALTAFAREIDAKRAIEAGFDAYLPKPVPTDALVSTLRGLADASTR